MDDPLLRQAEAALAQGSKSFGLAMRLLDVETRASATLLYFWCRSLDDIIDKQTLGFPASSASGEPSTAILRRSTELALEGTPQGDPVFEALRRVVRQHHIPHGEPLALIDGFAMDIGGRCYDTIDDTLDYCFHVAGVVGLMMARVLGVDDKATLDHACDLGLAFQLTNIARDVVDDWSVGRCYLPTAWLREEGLCPFTLGDEDRREALARVAGRVIAMSEPFYASAASGLSALSPRQTWAIGTARHVYRAIGRRVLTAGPHAWNQRTVVGRRRKAAFAMAAGATALTRALGARPASRRPPDLWRRPDLLSSS